MSATATAIRPWTVGETAVVIVGIEGVIEARTDDTITVNGLTLPIRLNSERGPQYLSMVWPDGDETTCSRDHCTGVCEMRSTEEESLDDRLTQFVAEVRVLHERDHSGAMRFCADRLCRMADEETQP